MTIHALITGTLFHDPETRQSKSGRSFVSATLRVKGDETSQFCRLIAFSEHVQAELLRLKDGDALSVQGRLSVETYAKDGETRVGLSMVADQVMALRQPPKERKTNEADAAERAFKKPERGGTWRDERDGPNDPWPI